MEDLKRLMAEAAERTAKGTTMTGLFVNIGSVVDTMLLGAYNQQYACWLVGVAAMPDRRNYGLVLSGVAQSDKDWGFGVPQEDRPGYYPVRYCTGGD